MLDAAAVEKLILEALERLNAELPEDQRFTPTSDMPLLGVDAVIDSLAIISLIVDIEGALNDVHGLDVALTDDRAVSQSVSPFTNVQALKDYILLLLAEAQS